MKCLVFLLIAFLSFKHSFASDEKSLRLSDSTYYENEPVFEIVEKHANFPGGQDSMIKFIYDKLEYPSVAIQSKIEGIVAIQFIVEKDGSLSSFNIIREIGGGCGDEAIRIIKSMPNWIPGKQRGQAVRQRMTVPIKFKLSK